MPFTNDKERLLEALRKLSEHVPSGRFTASERIHTQQQIDDLFTTIYPETLVGAPPSPEVQKPLDPLKRALMRDVNTLRSFLVIANTFQARAVFVALRALAVAYRDLPGRKSVVIFSEGFLHAGDTAELQAVIDAANRAGVAFYVIDASGANSRMSAEVRAPDIGGRRTNPDMMEALRLENPLGGNVFDWNTTLASDVHEDLGVIANATGGFLVSDTNGLVPAIERVEQDASEFYTLVYHPTNRRYNGAFRKIKVAVETGGYRLRFRQGYWAIPPGREVMMTPAAAQLLSALEGGSRKPTFAPEVNAALVQSREGRFAIPVAVSLPGSLVPFDKVKDRYTARLTMLLVARDAQGQLVALHERYGDLRFNKRERDEFRQKTFNLQGHIPVPELEPITVQAIVEFSGHVLGMSTPVRLEAGEATAPEVTGLVLSNHVEQADCTADLTDPLCVKNMRIYLPGRESFLPSERLTLFFAVLDLTPDQQTRLPALSVTLELHLGKETRQIGAERIQAAPGTAKDSLVVLAQVTLPDLKSGRYVLQANAEDTVRQKKSTRQIEFSVQ